jgi:hypothetical protein
MVRIICAASSWENKVPIEIKWSLKWKTELKGFRVHIIELNSQKWRIVLKSNSLRLMKVPESFIALMPLFFKDIEDFVSIIIEPLDGICNFIFGASFALYYRVKEYSESFKSIRVPKCGFRVSLLLYLFHIIYTYSCPSSCTLFLISKVNFNIEHPVSYVRVRLIIVYHSSFVFCLWDNNSAIS